MTEKLLAFANHATVDSEPALSSSTTQPITTSSPSLSTATSGMCFYTYEELRPLILPLILGRVEEETFHGIQKRWYSNSNKDTASGREKSRTISRKVKGITTHICNRKDDVDNTNNDNGNDIEINIATDMLLNMSSFSDNDDDNCYKEDNSYKKKNQENSTKNNTVIYNTHMIPPSPTTMQQDSSTTKTSKIASLPSLASSSPSSLRLDPLYRPATSPAKTIKSVLEINSGIHPLSLDLQSDLLSLQQVTGLNATLVVNKIVCCDDNEDNIDYLLSSSSGVGDDDQQLPLSEMDEEKDEDEEEKEIMVETIQADDGQRGRRRRRKRKLPQLRRQQQQQHWNHDYQQYELHENKKPMLCVSIDDEVDEMIDKENKTERSRTVLHSSVDCNGKEKEPIESLSSTATPVTQPLSPLQQIELLSSTCQQITPPYPLQEERHRYHNHQNRYNQHEQQKYLNVEYIVADASKQIPYGNDEFHLIIEKSMELDCMMMMMMQQQQQSYSHHYQEKKERCVMMIMEMARVLTEGGYMMIVSRMNAETKQGRDWINEVIVPGLRIGGGDAMWEIEVHAFVDECQQRHFDDDEEENSFPKSKDMQYHEEEKKEIDERNLNLSIKREQNTILSPQGLDDVPPAVYIIHKKSPTSLPRSYPLSPLTPLRFKTCPQSFRDHDTESSSQSPVSSPSSAMTAKAGNNGYQLPTTIPLNLVTYSQSQYDDFQH